MSMQRILFALYCCILAFGCATQPDHPDKPQEIATDRLLCQQIASDPFVITSGCCGNGICELSENALNCPSDCSTCGDGVCTSPETATNCPVDCRPVAFCGDGICNGSEGTATCPGDCGTRCGDGVCNGSEGTDSCPGDCGTRCGDGVCNGGETESSCAADCTIRNDPPFQETVLQDGGTWTLKNLSGSAVDPVTGQGRSFNESYWVIHPSGIQSSPLSTFMKQTLADQALDPTAVLTLSASIVNGIDTSLAQGSLTPELAAIAEPLDGVAQAELPTIGERVITPFGGGGCSDKLINQSRTFGVNTPFNFSTNPGSGFSGSLSGSGSIQASATGEFQIALKRVKILFWCIPYGVRLNYAHAFGSATVGYGSSLTGTASFSHSWEWELAKIPLFSLDFFIGPIPVHVGFNLPISLGLDLQATATGTVTYTGSQSATGAFNYNCTMSGCTGSSSFTQNNPVSPQIGTAGISGRIQPNVWIQAAFRGYLYTEWLAYAQLGVRPILQGDLWGYVGNNCGDADGDGIAENVDALALDLDLQVNVTAQAAAFGGSPSHWNDLWHTPRFHLGFWDLIGSEALQPMDGGSSAAAVGVSQPYTAKMRPCYPYTDPVSYQFNWGDGTTSNTSGAPQTGAAAGHTWGSTGTKTVALTAFSDTHGRTFNTSTSRNILVGSGTWTPWLNRDAPSGVGDFETLPDFGSQVPCSSPIAIQCQTLAGVDYTLTGEVYSCTPASGGICRNSDQPDGACMDYQVRFLCP